MEEARKTEYMMKKRKDGTFSILRKTDGGPVGMFHKLDKKAADNIMKKLEGGADARDRRERGIPDVKGKYAGQRLFASFQEHVEFADEQLDEMSAKAHYKTYQAKFKAPPIDRDRYPNREAQGLEGPFQTKKTRKIFYYDKKAGKYYDPDTDMYLQVSDIMEDVEQVDEIVRAKDNYPEIDKIKKVLKKKGIGFYTSKGKIMVNPANVVEARSALNKAFGGQFEKKTGMEVKADKKQPLSAAHHVEEGVQLDEDGHTDVASAKMKVDIAGKALIRMKMELSKLPNEASLPSWWTDKVAIAVDKLDGMADYLDSVVEDVQLDEAVDQKQLLAMYKKLKKGDKIDVTFDSSIRKGKEPMTLIVTSPHRAVGRAKVGRIIFKDVENMGGVKYFWYNRDDKISMAQGDMAVSPREVKMSTDEGFASDAQRRAAFASGYKAKGKKGKKGKKEETELEESTPEYRAMMKKYKGSDMEKVFKMLRAKGFKVGEQDDTLVRNLLKRHKGNVKKVVDQIMKDYPGKFDVERMMMDDVQEGKKMKVKLDPNKSMDKVVKTLEDKMTDAEMDKREKIVKSMKKRKDDFKARYGDQADDVMYATATKMAMKDSYELEDGSTINESFESEFPTSQVEVLAANMTPVVRDRWVIKEAPFDDIKKIVADKSMMTVKFPDGKQKVDMMTANVLMTVYDALNDKNKKKFVEKINAKMGNFLKLVQFAYSAVNPK